MAPHHFWPPFSRSRSQTKDFSLPIHYGLPKLSDFFFIFLGVGGGGGVEKKSEWVAQIVKKKGEPIFVNSLELQNFVHNYKSRKL